ncbi:YhcB family protein [Kushneria sp. Sum13]|uniref:YhcB family protein n=1 Tax=Kushneria sp. Sum13 TaxID=3459196 RepID=UPI004046599E
MNEGNIDWVVAIVALLAGIAIGVLIRHFSGSQRNTSQKLKQRLAETELELKKLRESVNTHFADVTTLARNITRQSEELQARLDTDAGTMASDPALKRPRQADVVEDSEEDTSSLHIPRDYADSNGTLDESYGLRQKQEGDSTDPQPPRY